MHQTIASSNILDFNHIGHNLATLTSENSTSSDSQALSQKTLFSRLDDSSAQEHLRDELKFSYSKDVLSLNMLLDKSLDQLILLNNGIEVNASRRYGSHNETRE
jgi:hypothetical protein